MTSKSSKIAEILSIYPCRSSDSFEYALYCTLDMEELCDSFFAKMENANIRNNIVKHLVRRTSRLGQHIPAQFTEALIEKFQASEKRSRITLGTTIKNLRHSLSKTQQRRFFDLQILSGRISDRKRAYELADNIYCEEVDKSLWKSWKMYGDENCILVLAKHSSEHDLLASFNEVWSSSNFRRSTKNSVLKRVAKYDFSAVKFLESESPISYLTACVSAGVIPAEEQAIKIVLTAKSIGSFRYAVWCLGTLGMYDTLVKLLAQAEEIEKGMAVEFWEPEFYSRLSDESKDK